MSIKKYKPKPYVHQDWPRMFYHPETAEYIICQDGSEVPDGFFGDINDCKNPPQGTDEPSPYRGPIDLPKPLDDKDDQKEEEKEEVKDKVDVSKNEVNPTLESLKITRKDALALLAEENVKCPKNATNDKVALLVAELLRDD